MKTSIIVVITINFCLLSCSVFAQEVDKEYILKRINSMREKGCMCGEVYCPPVQALVWNDTLELVSQQHSDDMQKENYFGHTDKKGHSAGFRLNEKGYLYLICADNIADGYGTDEAVMLGWRQSPTHCKNMMNKNVNEVAVARNGELWTMTLARRAKNNSRIRY